MNSLCWSLIDLRENKQIALYAFRWICLLTQICKVLMVMYVQQKMFCICLYLYRSATFLAVRNWLHFYLFSYIVFEIAINKERKILNKATEQSDFNIYIDSAYLNMVLLGNFTMHNANRFPFANGSRGKLTNGTYKRYACFC